MTLIAMTEVHISEDAKRLLLQVADSGQLAQGPIVAEFERLFAAACNSQHGVAVANGTLALQAALLACGVGEGDEVITSPLTFVATVNSILAVGASVRFADIGPDYQIDPGSVEALITSRTAAILPVHLYGMPCDMPALSRLADRYSLVLIEDAAQAHGASVNGRPIGSWGDVGCFSFYATKNVSAGEGGMLVTDDGRIAAQCRILRNQGMTGKYQYQGWGSNWRMSDLHAAIAIPQVRALPTITMQRKKNAARLSEGLTDLGGVCLPLIPPGRDSAWHQFTIRMEEGAGVGRDELATRLAARDVQTAVHYPHAMPDVAHLREHPLVHQDEVPRARAYAKQVLSIPVGHHLGTEQIDRVVESMSEALWRR